jgi:NADPH:quinone reductase-like Zn-dependent oxidoreductase
LRRAFPQCFLFSLGTIVRNLNCFAGRFKFRSLIPTGATLTDRRDALPARLCGSFKFDSGKLVTHVGTVLPLEDARAAHEMLARATHKRGKIVLEIAA